MTSEHDFPDSRPIFEARPNLEYPFVWEIWDIEHPSEFNHFRVAVFNSHGASDDMHEDYALIAADAMNRRYARMANQRRRAEAEMERERHG